MTIAKAASYPMLLPLQLFGGRGSSSQTPQEADSAMPYIDRGRISLFFEDADSGGRPVLLLHEFGRSSEPTAADIYRI